MMAKPLANLRLFAAIYPPAHLAQAWRDSLGALNLPPHRLVPTEQVHLTVQFIGDTPAKELDDVIESVERATGGLSRFALAAKELIRLPERGPARLIAMETDAHPTLLELQKRLALRLARNVREKPGKRFRPHFTLCRFRSPSRVPPIEAAIANEAFNVDRILLMRSTLRPKGAEHVEVASFGLRVA